MFHTTRETQRLTLVAATPKLLDAELTGAAELAAVLNARTPAHWPPPLSTKENVCFVRERLDEWPDEVGWWSWYILLRHPAEAALEPIGICGLKGPPDATQTVEVGFSILEQFQNRGYATEASRAVMAWAVESGQVKRIMAHTLPSLPSSCRVLEKLGFHRDGRGPATEAPEVDEPILRYVAVIGSPKD